MDTKMNPLWITEWVAVPMEFQGDNCGWNSKIITSPCKKMKLAPPAQGAVITQGTHKPLEKKRPVSNGPKVQIPDGNAMSATHECELFIQNVSPQAQHTIVYPKNKSGNL
eukprot:11893162-Ditylum_brightwellii.AAC.2